MEQEIARMLWNRCFHDPQAYEDFYFEEVYPKNRVYLDGEKGMLHLNPYLCHVNRQQIVLHYIVGVATDARYRRRGVMRGLVRKALQDMWVDKEPLTYLMPADVQYYEPFGFVSIRKEQQEKVSGMGLSAAQTLPYSFCTYEVLMRNGDTEQLFRKLEMAIQNRYQVSAVHDMDYFRRLYKEKACQHGNIVFVFDQKRQIQGYFAYAMDEETVRIEQIFWMGIDRTQEVVRQYFHQPVYLWQSFPYMMRIVHVQSFLQALSKPCSSLLHGKEGFYIQDPMLEGNTGCYRASGNWCRERGLSTQQIQEDYREITVEQLVEELFGECDTYRHEVWFAEVV